MNSRRELLATLGAITLAGCTSESSEQGNSQPENTGNNEEPDRELSVPFGGLGAYEDAVNNADSIDEANGVTAGQIHDILEQSDTVQEEADELSNLGTTNNIHSILQEYHLEKNEGDNMVIANINWSFTSDSEPIIEYHTVQNGQLQGNPIITDPNHELKKHKPGQNQPEYLANLRQSDKAASLLPGDIEGMNERVEHYEENRDISEDKIRQFREMVMNEWSRTLFGVDDEPNVRPADLESGIALYEAKYGDGDANMLAQASNQYAESEHFNADYMVEAEYTGNGWEFSPNPNTELGDELSSRQ